MSKHTPGPWKVQLMNRPGDAGDEWGIFEDGATIGDKLVCVTYGRKGAQRAPLIAAAPDLLAAAEAALHQLILAQSGGLGDEGWKHLKLDTLRAAISRARGEE